MIRPDDLLQYIALYEAEHNGQGPDANAVAEQFGLWYGEVSQALNQLVLEGRLQKCGKRPVCYLRATATASGGGAEPEPPPFANMIGYQGSLKFQTQMASAAAAYPPYGIHTLIVGETGVGKSLMASEMARYLRQRQGRNSAPFIMFNCAEYADNPQLLLSQLFGYVKGAFTGADRDKEGLVEKANEGILFLDEIHRLPATGQEMLFTVVDKGLYRRLGDTVDRTARFMIVGATTENPANVLLDTFKRRIPLTIQIPLLCERPIDERLSIICLFFWQESCRLGMSIRISYLALKLLVSFQGKNNIGDLKNEVQIACARGYLEHTQQHTETRPGSSIDIDVYNISRNLSIHYIPDTRVDRYLTAVGLGEGIEILPDKPLSFSDRPDTQAGPEFTSFLQKQTIDHDPQDAAQQLVSNLALHCENVQKNHRSDGINSLLYGSIAPAVWIAANEIIRYASTEFGRTYTQDTINSVAYYLQQLQVYANAGRILFSPTCFDASNTFCREMAFARKMVPFLHKQLNIELMEGEMVLLAMLLSQEVTGGDMSDKNLILVGYGHAASDAAAFANKLLNTKFIKAFDITEDVDTVLFRLGSFLEKTSMDTLIFSGLGVDSILERVLTKITHFSYYVIPVLDSMLTLECGRMILMDNGPLSEVISGLTAECRDYFSVDIHVSLFRQVNQISAPPLEEPKLPADIRDVIITYCITGTGSARIARERLLQDLTVTSTADVLALGIMDDIYAVAHKLGRRLKLVIGIINPGIQGVPFVSMEEIFYASNLDQLLRTKGIQLPTESDLEAQEISRMPLKTRLIHCREHLNYFSPSLEYEKVDAAAHYIIDQIDGLYRGHLSSDLAVRIYIHCATMFQRIATADPVPMPLDGYTAIEHNSKWFNRLREILNHGCRSLDLSVEDAEVYYLMMTLPADGIHFSSVQDPVT